MMKMEGFGGVARKLEMCTDTKFVSLAAHETGKEHFQSQRRSATSSSRLTPHCQLRLFTKEVNLRVEMACQDQTDARHT